jgi:hypothetical protein
MPITQAVEAITPNTVTPYIVAFSDLRGGPIVVEVPATIIADILPDIVNLEASPTIFWKISGCIRYENGLTI